MKDKRLLTSVSAVAFALGLGISAAQAADPPMIAPPPSTWAGFYIGVHAGYGNADLDYDNQVGTINTDTAVQAFQNDPNGGLVGFHLGYNWQWDSIVAGVEGDVDWLHSWDTFGAATQDSSDIFEGDMDYLASVRARLGYVIDNDTLVYITGGIAFTDSEQTFHAGSSDSQEEVTHNVGGVVGAGVAHMITPRFSVRAEALYYIFGDQDYTCIGTCSGTNFTTGDKQADIDLDVFTFRVGASYHF